MHKFSYFPQHYTAHQIWENTNRNKPKTVANLRMLQNANSVSNNCSTALLLVTQRSKKLVVERSILKKGNSNHRGKTIPHDQMKRADLPPWRRLLQSRNLFRLQGASPTPVQGRHIHAATHIHYAMILNFHLGQR